MATTRTSLLDELLDDVVVVGDVRQEQVGGHVPVADGAHAAGGVEAVVVDQAVGVVLVHEVQVQRDGVREARATHLAPFGDRGDGRRRKRCCGGKKRDG